MKEDQCSPGNNQLCQQFTKRTTPTGDNRHNGSKKKLDKRWILCPACGQKTRNRVRRDTILINYPLYCPKCKQESLIQVKDLHMTIIKEPDA